MNPDKRVDFGFSSVDPERQAAAVRQVFTSVSPGYDAMNDIMSLGMHRLWKRFAVHLSSLRPGQSVLDVAGGTGDMARLCKQRVGSEGRVVLLDANHSMLAVGRARAVDDGLGGDVKHVCGDAARPPFPDASFDLVTLAFGLRNFPARADALAALRKLLRPGGSLLLLEFSTPDSPLLARMFRLYCLKVLPTMGKMYMQDEDSYRYLGESIHTYPDRHKVTGMLHAAGYGRVLCNVLAGGVVTMHRAFLP